ncbi:transmembrane protein 74B isoform X1 [Sarcophilus harrisii]|uniref:transmembrane protein 74B isoform X1 n=1 Tax=Sarcophilus harrisii TaxID=9305 RepID=UPI001302000E|nr:transmembrane protein 74B isoform X1 [Sarcophilus harrisii]
MQKRRDSLAAGVFGSAWAWGWRRRQMSAPQSGLFIMAWRKGTLGRQPTASLVCESLKWVLGKGTLLLFRLKRAPGARATSWSPVKPQRPLLPPGSPGSAGPPLPPHSSLSPRCHRARWGQSLTSRLPGRSGAGAGSEAGQRPGPGYKGWLGRTGTRQTARVSPRRARACSGGPGGGAGRGKVAARGLEECGGWCNRHPGDPPESRPPSPSRGPRGPARCQEPEEGRTRSPARCLRYSVISSPPPPPPPPSSAARWAPSLLRSPRSR